MTDAWGQPAQQQYAQQPQQGWGPPQGAPQGPPPGFNQGQPQGAPQQPQGPTPDFGADDFFKRAGGGGNQGAASFKFGDVGTGLMGVIESRTVQAKTKPAKPGQQPILHLDKNGQQLWQLRVILQTQMQGWAGVDPTKIPTNDQGQQLPDDGRRAIYLWYTLRDAVEAAVATAGVDNLADGGTLGVKVIGTEPNSMGGNPIKQYAAVYYPPGQAPAAAQPQVQQAQPQQQPVQQPQQQYAPSQQQAQPGPQQLAGQPNPAAQQQYAPQQQPAGPPAQQAQPGAAGPAGWDGAQQGFSGEPPF